MSPRPVPAHGTPSRYRGDPRGIRWEPCRCQPCGDSRRRQRKTCELRTARTGSGRYDIAPVAAHIERLLDSGWTLERIEQASGADRRGMYNIRHLLQKTVNYATATKILALKPAGQPRHVDPTGTRRRVQALVAIGWSLTWIGRQTDLSHTAIEDIARSRFKTVKTSTAQAIEALYRQYAYRPGPSGWVRAFAARNGWHSPLAWDGNIDDPAAQPDSGDITNIEMKRNELAALRREEIEHLTRFGATPEQIKDRLSGDDLSLSHIRAVVAELRTGKKADRSKQAVSA